MQRTPKVRLFLLAVGVFAVFDAIRCLLPATPVDIEAWRPSFFFQHVRAEGLPHLEQAAGYEHISFYSRGNSLTPTLPSDVIARRPYLLVPLNRPERSEGLLVVAEVPLEAGELPPGFDPNEIEFEGTLGPMPKDVLEVAKMNLPQAKQVTRLQLGVHPSVWISFALLAWAAVLLRVDRRLNEGHAGAMSRISMVTCSLYLLWFLLLRLKGDLDANEWAPCIFGLLLAGIGHYGYLQLARPPRTGLGRGLSDSEYAKAMALHDDLKLK